MTLGGCYYYPHLIGESIEIQESQPLDSHEYLFLSLHLSNALWLSMLMSAFPPRLWEPWNEEPMGVPTGALLDHRGLGPGKCSASPCRISLSTEEKPASEKQVMPWPDPQSTVLSPVWQHCYFSFHFLKLLLGHYSSTRWKWGVPAAQL